MRKSCKPDWFKIISWGAIFVLGVTVWALAGIGAAWLAGLLA